MTEKILSGLLNRISPFAALWSSGLSSAATSVQTAGAFKGAEDEESSLRMVTLLFVLMTLMAMVVMIRMIVMLTMTLLVASSSS